MSIEVAIVTVMAVLICAIMGIWALFGGLFRLVLVGLGKVLALGCGSLNIGDQCQRGRWHFGSHEGQWHPGPTDRMVWRRRWDTRHEYIQPLEWHEVQEGVQ